MTHVAVRKTSYRASKLTETGLHFEAGDEGETLVAMNLRGEEDVSSQVVGSLGERSRFTVIDVGANHRALISSADLTGWISTQTDLDQPLCGKLAHRQRHNELGVYEAKVSLNVRALEDFKSEVIGTIPGGVSFQLVDEGAYNRCKVLADGLVGWITTQTEVGQPLISRLDKPTEVKLTSPLDNAVANAFAKSASQKPGANDLDVYKTKSGRVVHHEEASPAKKTVPAAAIPSSDRKTPPKSSFMACCCGS